MRIDRFGVQNLYAQSEMGPFFLSNNNVDDVRKLDECKQLDRINPNKKVWYYCPEFMGVVTDFKDEYKESKAFIFGKGPSLDLANKIKFCDNDILFCCNDSIKKIKQLNLSNKIFTVQFDPDAGHIDFGTSTMIIRPICSQHYENDKVYIATTKMLNNVNLHPCGTFAIELAKFMGCKNLTLVGFDGAFGDSLEYAKVIGYKSTKARTPDPTRFRFHKPKLLKALEGTTYTIRTYKELEAPNAGSTQQSQ